LNTFPSNPFDGDPDDILDLSVTPRATASAQASLATLEPAMPEEPTTTPPRNTLPDQEDGWFVAPTADGIIDASAAAVDSWARNELPPTQAESDEAPDSLTDIPDNEPHWFGLMVRETVETVGLAVIIFLIIRIGIQNYRIEGASMEPNFHDGEYLIVNKLAYRLGEYERGDVIVFKYPNDPSKDYIKRVIGLPGDTVEIRGGQLFVNGNQIEEPYEHMPNARDEPPTVVDAGHLYVMGDNRPASSDTRSWGQLGQEFVIGQAWLAIWPFEQAGLVEHHPIVVNPVMAQGP